MERNYALDILKAIAMVCVVGLHSLYSYIISGSTSLADVLYDACGVSIPLFFMVSGYLLLPREQVTYAYCARKVWGIVRFVAIVCIGWWLVFSLKNGFHIQKLVDDFLGAFVQKGAFSVFWYLGAMVICYVLLPILNNLFIRRPKIFYFLLAILAIVCSFMFCNTIAGSRWEMLIPATFRLWYILFYFCIGGALTRIRSLQTNSWSVILLLFAAIVFKELTDKWFGSEYVSSYYSSLPFMMLCVAIFSSIAWRTVTKVRLARQLSQLFLPVYTFHGLIILFAPSVPASMGAIAPLLNWIWVVSLSVVLSVFVMKLPMADKIFRI
ncbi:MAG: acyltransferase family protein [Prevotella sp.]|nr:acyltransferase family protein [Prevotella sp.]